MRTELSFTKLPEIKTELLAVVAANNQTAKGPDARPQPVLLTTDAAVKAAAEAVLASGEYKAGANETLLLHAPAGLAAKPFCTSCDGEHRSAAGHCIGADGSGASGCSAAMAPGRGADGAGVQG